MQILTYIFNFILRKLCLPPNYNQLCKRNFGQQLYTKEANNILISIDSIGSNRSNNFLGEYRGKKALKVLTARSKNHFSVLKQN